MENNNCLTNQDKIATCCGRLKCKCQTCRENREANDKCAEALSKPCEIQKYEDVKALEPTSKSEAGGGPSGNAGGTEVSLFSLGPQVTNLGSVLFDIVGAFAFFIMVTTIFWITASFYFKRLLVDLYHAPRRTQIIVLTLLGLFTLGIIIHAIVATRKHTPPPISSSTDTTSEQELIIADQLAAEEITVPEPEPIVEKKNSKVNMCRSRSTDSRLKGGQCKRNCPPGKAKSYIFCPKYDATKCKKKAASNLCLTLVDKSTNTPAISDEEGLEIFRTYRTYSYPMDMKAPPAILVYIRDYIANYICPMNRNGQPV